ncbi:hypothetical protein [Asanoa iriomotensis]|uniref:Uncharacterized protein n=1 Tax=Asanoa iriomotensis TaxID=234613 RepID=A0ABQ4BZQ9_9ACTN|nr:hypothetical protein [Asanoa iriomotensis]GIF55661.1 hypothetical protein Air01nite_17560 [Asanoa iriomotensis]
MLVPTAMVMADNATKQHVLSARPTAPTTHAPAARRRQAGAARRFTVATLRRLADNVENRGIPAPTH